MSFVPPELMREAFRTAMRMPQVTMIVPAGYRVTGEYKPLAGRGYVQQGFMLGGHQADGTAIPGYNFATGKGLVWTTVYLNREPLETRTPKEFYLTPEYLYDQIWFGPQPITESLVISVENRLDQDVYFTQTSFWFELPLEVIMKIFAPLAPPAPPARRL